jgi:hypothetical protein
MKPTVGFSLGVVAGCVGLLIAQSSTSPPPPGQAPAVDRANSLAVQRQEQQLAIARKKIDNLEAELAAIAAAQGQAVAGSVDPDGGAAESATSDEEKGKQNGSSILEMMMAMGDKKSQREVEVQAELLAGRLGLSEDQQGVVRDALLQKVSRQREAAKMLMSGKATIADLAASDEHNFISADAAIMAVLDAGQLEEFAAYQGERETKRVEKKATEELDGLTDVASLSPEQEDAAWKIFADLNAADKPGEIPEGTTREEFLGFIDGSIGKRIDGLTPILTDEQITAYRGQTAAFREMVTKLVGHALEAGE